MTTKANKFFSLAVLAVLFAYVYWFSANVLWLGDDIYYRFVVGSFPSRPIMAFADVVKSQMAHYHMENGRVEAHFIAQMLLSFSPKWLFALLNAAAYVVFTLLVVKMGLRLRKDEQSQGDSPLCHPLAVAFVAVLTQTCLFLKFVPTTAMYIWMYDIALCYLYVLFYKCPNSWLMTLPLFIFGILAGAAHESLSMGVVVGLFFYGIFRIRRLSLNEIVMMVGFALGFLSIALAPATGERMAQFSSSATLVAWSLVYLKATFVQLAVLIIGKMKRGVSLRDFCRRYSFWLVSMLAIAVFVYVIIGIGGPRPLLGVEMIAMILTIAIWREARVNKAVAVVGLCLFLGLLGYKTVRDVKAVGSGQAAYDELCKEFCASGNGTIVKEFDLSSYPSRFDEYVLPGVMENLRSTDKVTDDYFIDNLSKNLNLEYGTDKPLRILPPIAGQLSTMPDSTQIVNAAEGVYYLIISKRQAPKRVVEHRSLGPIRWSDYVAYPTGEKPDYETDVLALYPAYAEKHIVDVDSLTIEW